MQCICTFSRIKRFHTIEYVPISKRIPSRPESRVRVGLSWQVDVGHYCWKPSTATGCGQKKSVMAVCHCEQCAGRLTEDRRMPCLSNTPPQPQPTTTTTTTATTNYQSNNHHFKHISNFKSNNSNDSNYNSSSNIHWYQSTSCPCSTVVSKGIKQQDCLTDCQRQDPRQHYAFEHLLRIGCHLSTLISQLRGPLQRFLRIIVSRWFCFYPIWLSERFQSLHYTMQPLKHLISLIKRKIPGCINST